ncbi:MAG TPA: T9SS type A sorting domain-containing protein, partial [Flavisolibacter sp.]
TRAIIIDQNDVTGNTIFAGSVSGGLWKTSNFKSAAPTWTQVATVSANLAITALAQDPSNSNIMYAGTGEGFSNIDAVRGLGIYKTIDGGNTWSLLASTTTGGANVNDFSFVQKILVYTNGHVYASAISASFCNSGGILKSTNGGTTWTRVIGNYTGGGTCNNAFDFAGYDIEMSKDGDLYASVIDNGFSFVAPATTDTTIGKVYRSPAGASVGNLGTWVNVTPPPPIEAGSYWERIELACSPTNNNTVYALIQGMVSEVGGVRVSTDAGTTWTPIDVTTMWCDQGSATSTDFSRGQAWYDLCIAVKPNDDQTIYVGGVDLMKTTDGGTTWNQNTQWAAGCGVLPNIHADNHNIFFFPGSPNEFIVVNDGGIYYSADNGASYTNKSAGYNTIQYYSAALHPTAASNYMLAGAQDNGSHKFSAAGLGSVTEVTGGDGGFCFIDQDNPNIQVTAYTNCYFEVSRDGGANFSVPAYFGANGRFINPSDYDNTANLLFAGYTTGRILRVNNIASGAVSGTSLNVAAAASRTLSAIKVDPNTANKLWAAFCGGGLTPVLVSMTNTAGVPVSTTITLPATITASHYISSVDVENGNANHILLTVSNYGVTSVYESTNGGTNWTSLDNNGVNLPDMPVRWGMFSPGGGIMLATELGVWTASTTTGTTTAWQQSAGVPNVRVDMLDYRTSDQTVVAATHGRGLFTTVISSTLPVTLLDFKGKLDQQSILLDWTTSAEINSKDFTVEKSANGNEYYKIGVVLAAGNSTSDRTYQFRDPQVYPVNHYRLRMRDLDGTEQISKVVVIRSSSSRQNVWTVNNPFHNYIDLRFGKEAKQVELQLLNTGGSIISKKNFSNISNQVRWNVPGNLSAGTYILRSYVDGELFTHKLVKQ